MQETQEHPSEAAGQAQGPRPVLIYDGDCGFCGYWARYWQKLTHDQVEYRTYQQAGADYPTIPTSDFQRAVQYITPDGHRASAAEASFLTLSHARNNRIWLRLYRSLPGFAPISETAYRFIAAHRSACYRVSLLLWGKQHEPPRYDLTAAFFLRLLGLIYLSAFVSFGVQAQGLIGSHGILPLTDWVDAVAGELGTQRFWLVPMVFWWNSSDLAILAVCWAGAVFSLLLAFNVVPRISLLVLYGLYLSLFYAGQVFMTFQWDTFLLETGFTALLMSFARVPGVWLLRWLLFRFMFMSGVVKLSSGDPNWWNLSALTYHFVTQPLPTPLAWYAAQLPSGVLKFAVGCMLFIELCLPFLIFCPRRLRFCAAIGMLLLETCILLTGNYNWFNLQTMLLCLILFDDAALRNTALRRLPSPREIRPPRTLNAVAINALGILIVICSLVQMDQRFGGDPPAVAQAVNRVIEPLHIANAYGLFAVMTTERDEIIVQGSYDGIDWRDYEFRYKPGDVTRPPSWNIPHQPRLDWQMWFAALDDPQHLPWFSHFLQRLLENEPSVLALLKTNPFPNKQPLYVRAQFYEYRFADSQEHAKGQFWQRRLLGLYFPVSHLSNN
ncbi:lipase maturation factor family protein [Acidisphaera sp. S103]|uniref:lipase maturation factor family protein n=1 Tax=Acidisphaera sp. S103 TaxID=1747223 RepID=UPI00131DF4B5|nr:lipase maturation factor family protein [Acidisphaera sp. S103]